MLSIEEGRKKGGIRYAELYGSPGTVEGRRKGGINSQRKRRENRGYARKLEFALRKRIKHPDKSSELAEFIGIMLGDGGMHSDYQIAISFNPKEDLPYAHYVQSLIAKLFLISSTIKIRRERSRGDVVVSSRNLVEFLKQYGIKKGNKLTNMVDVPEWIWDSKEYKIACLRGLVDTDGGFYRHKYRVNGKDYTYLKMCFTSYSGPLLKSATYILGDLGLGPKNTAENRVYLYSLNQIKKYFAIVGSNNPRYCDIYKKFIKSYN